MLSMTVAAAAFVVALSQAWRFRQQADDQAKARALISEIGIAGIAMSIVGLFAMLSHAGLVARQTGNSAYVLPYYSWSVIPGGVGFFFSLFNSGRSRLIACACSVLITALWFQVAMLP
jgi:hypothetical protein